MKYSVPGATKCNKITMLPKRGVERLNEVDKTMLTVSELADYLRLSRSMAYELTRRAGFPCLRIGRKILVPADGLKAWVDEQIQTS